MHVLRRPAFALYAACAVVVATPAAAPAALSPSRAVSNAGLAVEHFGIAMNPAGERSVVAFEGLVRGSRGRRTQLFARLGSGRSFGAGQELEDLRSGPGFRRQASISDVRVAVGPDGVAVVAWIVTTVEQRDGSVLRRAFVATAPAGKRFGRPQTVLRAPRSNTIYIAGLVAGARGRAVICLERGSRVEVLVRRRLGGRFGAPQQIGGATAFEAPPSLAIASDGTVVAAWTEERVATTKAALLRTGGRRFGSARTISPAGEPTAYGHAVGGPGGAGVTWKHAVPRTTTPPNTPLRFARLRPGTGTFRAPVTTADVRASGAPHVALPRLGIATAWRNYQVITEPGDNDFFGNSRLSATAPWLGVDGPRGLSALPALALRPAAAALPEHALIAWEQLPADKSDTRVRLAVAGPDGWLPALTVPPTGAPQRARGRSAILGDERPGAGDLAIAAGRRSALLAYSAVTQDRDGELSGRLRVAGYRP